MTTLCCFTAAFQIARGKPGLPSSSCQEPLSNRGKASWVKAQFFLVRNSCLPLGPTGTERTELPQAVWAQAAQIKPQSRPKAREAEAAAPPEAAAEMLVWYLCFSFWPISWSNLLCPSLTSFLVPVPLSSLSLPLLCGFITDSQGG